MQMRSYANRLMKRIKDSVRFKAAYPHISISAHHSIFFKSPCCALLFESDRFVYKSLNNPFTHKAALNRSGINTCAVMNATVHAA